MRNIYKILIFFIFFNCLLQAQNNEILGEAIIRDIYRVSNDTVQFDIVLKRLTDDWKYFANSTFHLTLDTTQFPFDNTNLVIERDSTGLPIGILTGNNNPLRGYTLTENIYQNKIVIGILGPETIEESSTLALNDEFVLGHYKIHSVDKRWIPLNIQWIKPTFYYQAAAYKIEKDSTADTFITFYHKNDNLELNNLEGPKLLFKETYLPFRDTVVLFDFIVEYMGQKRLNLSWITKEELNVVGYTIKRAFKPNFESDPATLDYKVIYTWRKDTNKKFNQEMISKGNTRYGFFYGILPDSIDIRGREYCYQLFCSFYDSTKKPVDKDIFLAQRCVPIPNSIILSAEVVSQNPFENEISVEFKLADDCLMTIKVYDLNGKEIEVIEDITTKEKIENKEMKLGIHTIKFDPMPQVASGSYYIYLIGYPINDKSLEVSTAILKVINLK